MSKSDANDDEIQSLERVNEILGGFNVDTKERMLRYLWARHVEEPKKRAYPSKSPAFSRGKAKEFLQPEPEAP